MTTAVLNSVESDKSGVASAVNGAIRETGFAFGVALLGTVMNQWYRSGFNGLSEIQALREPEDPATAPLQPVVAMVGDGINFAGRVVENPDLFPGLPAQISGTIRQASATAFIDGVDRAFIISGIAIIPGSFLSLALIKDRVADAASADFPLVRVPEGVGGSTAGS